jgi:phosphate:Na+ symporter
MDLLVLAVSLAGSVALLLWGVRMVQTGIQRALGARLRGLLAIALRNRVSSFLAGISVTAILQSSTATGLMVTGFAAGGLVDLVPALAVMLGANVGTTLIVQVLSFDVAVVAPALVLVGFLLFQRATAGLRDFGRVFIGLGLVLLALHQFIALLTPYEAAPGLRSILGAISTQPVLDVLLAAALTWAAHSSVAVVLLIMSFATKGTVPPEAALALVLGANLGTAINPVLEGATGNDPASRRLPLGNLLNRVVGITVALLALPWITAGVLAFEPSGARAVADFHTAFNLALALVFLPLLGPFAALLRRWLPTRVNQADPSRPLYLDPGAREIPAVALGAAAREALRMTDVLEDMLERFRDVLQRPDRRQIAEGKRLDDILDGLNTAIRAYIVSIDPASLTDDDHQRANAILTFAMNMEQAGDTVETGLLGTARKQLKRGVSFSREGKTELLDLTERLLTNARHAANLFVTEDLRAARILAAEKQEFRDKESKAIVVHFDRLRSGRAESAESGAIHLDLLREMKSVNSHLVAAAAYPVLERNDELLRTRLRADED